jgi:hypothetical protein
MLLKQLQLQPLRLKRNPSTLGATTPGEEEEAEVEEEAILARTTERNTIRVTEEVTIEVAEVDTEAIAEVETEVHIEVVMVVETSLTD